MGDLSKIDWLYHPHLGAGASWNDVTGCDKVSRGCLNCYALRTARRMKDAGQRRYQRDGDPRTSGPGFGVSVWPDLLPLPLSGKGWNRPRLVFVNSMSDRFHPLVPDDHIARSFAVMAVAAHTFILLTKRPKRMRALLCSTTFADDVAEAVETLPDWLPPETKLDPARWDDARRHLGQRRDGRTSRHMDPLPNVWGGVSVEDQSTAERWDLILRDVPLAVHVLSAEPLVGPLRLSPFAMSNTRARRQWIIVGGESGPAARAEPDGPPPEVQPMHPDWVSRLIYDASCVEGLLAPPRVYFKQWGQWSPWMPDQLTARRVTVANDGTVYQPGDLVPGGPRVTEALAAGHRNGRLTTMYRHPSKHSAGHDLVGAVSGQCLPAPRDHPDLPEVTLTAARIWKAKHR